MLQDEVAPNSPSQSSKEIGSEPSICSHCGLHVPTAFQKEEGPSFCCTGCEFVYGLLRSEGVSQPMVWQERKDLPLLAPNDLPHYHELDTEAFLKMYAKPLPDGLMQLYLYVENVHCGACVWVLEKLPSLMVGVISARLQLHRSLLLLTWDPQVKPLSTIARFIHSMGYPVEPYKESEKAKLRKQEDRKALVRLGIAGACAGNVMMISFALYSGLFSSMEKEYIQLFRGLSLLLSIPAVVWSARPFFQHAWAALKSRSIHIDLPITLGISVGFISGTIFTFIGQGEIFFDSVTALIFLLLVGRWLQRSQQRKAQDRMERMVRFLPLTTHRIEGTQKNLVSVEQLVQGDRIEVLPAEIIPCDGIILKGDSFLDSSILSGESKPIPTQEGQSVLAGTLNLSSVLQIQVSEIGYKTRMGKLLESIQDQVGEKAPIVHFADKVSGVFISVVLVLAIFTFLGWVWFDPMKAVENTIALLIVTCPCALGLATPLAFAVSLGRGANQGIFMKKGESLEILAKPGMIWLDKTGTLTEGKQCITSWVGDKSHQALVRTLEEHSSHPLASAFINAYPSPPSPPLWKKVEQLVGLGLQGTLEEKVWQVGSPRFLKQGCGDFPTWVTEAIDGVTKSASTPVIIGVDGKVKAVAGVGDALRAESLSTLTLLQEKGWKVGILSGDHPDVIDVIAKRLNLPKERCYGGLSPEEKQALIKTSVTHETTVMVGDGINDIAALASADVGISVHGGAEVSLVNADMYLAKPGLSSLVTLFEGAKSTLQTIHQGFIFSLVYNVVGASLAMAGVLSPLVAAVLMPLSSLTVVARTFQSSSFLEKE